MAINVSANFKNEMRQSVRLRSIGVISFTLDGVEHTISGNDTLKSMTKTEEGSFFGTSIVKLDFKIDGIGLDLRGVSCNAKLSQLFADGTTWEDCPWGDFEVTDMKFDENGKFTTFTAYNDMYIQLGNEYIPGTFAFPTTVAGLIAQINTEIGFAISTDPSTLPNANIPINEDLWATINGFTLRDMLGELAGATACLARVSTTPKTLDFIPAPLSFSGAEVLDDSQLITAKLGLPWGPANSIVVSRMPQNDNTVLSDDQSVAENGLTEVKLANNEILNDYREDAAVALLPAINGFMYENGECRTIGHGWHEVGDIMTLSISGNNYNVILTKIVVTVDGGVKESLYSVTPDRTNTDYSKAGGVARTIWNTALDVNRQANTINAIVQRQDTFEGETNDNFSRLDIDIDNVTTSIQNSGGANLIRNSAGYFKTSDGGYTYWDVTGPAMAVQDALAILRGSLSKMAWNMTGATLSQQIQVSISTAPDDDNVYTFAARIKKGAVGSGYIRIFNSAEEYRIDLASGQTANFDSVSVPKMRPKTGTYTIEIVGSADSDFMVSDMMLARGEFVSQWQQANGEFANLSVKIDSSGITTSSSANTGNYTQQLPSGFQGFENSQNTYGIDGFGVEAERATLRSGIIMPPIKIVPMTDGWAFVGTQ